MAYVQSNLPAGVTFALILLRAAHEYHPVFVKMGQLKTGVRKLRAKTVKGPAPPPGDSVAKVRFRTKPSFLQRLCEHDGGSEESQRLGEGRPGAWRLGDLIVPMKVLLPLGTDTPTTPQISQMGWGHWMCFCTAASATPPVASLLRFCT